ncbi:hypothetical protein ACFPN4_08540 [Ureibacillus thermophilus]|uniref:hypothetical protein n=1 Tax=Ureibacillus thermophilus TaxID=367743 RepID=UPI00361C44AF
MGCFCNFSDDWIVEHDIPAPNEVPSELIAAVSARNKEINTLIEVVSAQNVIPSAPITTVNAPIEEVFARIAILQSYQISNSNCIKQ